MARELTEREVEDLQRISASCKGIAHFGAPMIFDNHIDKDLRDHLQSVVDEAKRMRAYLRSHGIVGEDDRCRRTSPGTRL